MSWKNLASVAVCAMLASPALAAPTLDVVNGGLNGSGNWIWNVSVVPDAAFFVDNPPNGVGGSIAVELGFTAVGSSLVGTPTTSANVENMNPGNVIFGWETLTDVSEAQDGSNMKPVGLQVGTGADSNEVFAALGTTYFTSGGAKQIMTIITAGPTNTSLTTTLEVQGLLAQNDPATTNDTFAIAANTEFSRTVPLGDVNLDGMVESADLVLMSANWNQLPRHWGQGNLDGAGSGPGAGFRVESGDLVLLSSNWNFGVGSGGSAAVPEPSTIVLVGLAILGLVGIGRRK